eukprot:c52375_g1_i1.p1 GENE.c52375_g1_i1~~c52375_g1_i1.p1  ORF type:complete len:284 (+),score=39.87 c52375_g1_i1:76-927(+)
MFGCCLLPKAAEKDAGHLKLPMWCTDERDKAVLIWIRHMPEFDVIPDLVAVRFGQIRSYNRKRILHTLREHLLWIDKFQPSTILMAFVMKPLSTGVLRVIGHDFHGRPVIWGQLQHYDTSAFTPEEFVTLLIWMFNQTELMERDGANDIIMILELSHWRQKHALNVSHNMAFVDTLQNHFPFFIKTVVIFGANWFFQQAWAVISKWIEDEARERVHFVADSERKNYMHALMPHELIPTIYEGLADPPCPNIPGIPNITVTHNPTHHDTHADEIETGNLVEEQD